MKSMTDGLIIISKNYDFFIFLKNGIIKIIQPRTFYFFYGAITRNYYNLMFYRPGKIC